jgi:DNA-binding transcriptional ArsR family regulator
VADPKTKVESNVPLMLRLAKVFAEPLRIRIVRELNMREMSPKQFFSEFGGGSISRVSRHFEVLVEYDWLYLVRKESGGRRRGAIEHFYRATGAAIFDNETWSPLPDSMKEMISGRIFEEFGERVLEAMASRTFDARPDRHFTWTPIQLDQIGWKRVIARLDALFRFLFKEQKEANLRMAKSGEKPIPMTVALAGFESPKTTEKAH